MQREQTSLTIVRVSVLKSAFIGKKAVQPLNLFVKLRITRDPQAEIRERKSRLSRNRRLLRNRRLSRNRISVEIKMTAEVKMRAEGELGMW